LAQTIVAKVADAAVVVAVAAVATATIANPSRRARTKAAPKAHILTKRTRRSMRARTSNRGGTTKGATHKGRSRRSKRGASLARKAANTVADSRAAIAKARRTAATVSASVAAAAMARLATLMWCRAAQTAVARSM
jgi:hypothetical protein